MIQMHLRSLHSMPSAAILPLFLLGFWYPVNSDAQGSGISRERGSVVIGAFITDRNSETRLDSDTDQGTNLDLESDLGLEDSTTVARLGGYYWMRPKHRLDFAYFDLSRDASRRIDETIEFGDETYTVDTIVSTTNDLSITKLSYTFAPFATDRSFFGISFGLYVADTELSLRESTIGRFESEDITAPLPVFGLRGDYAFSENWTLRGAYELFDFESDDVDGRLSDMYVGIDYTFRERLSVGLAYNEVSMTLTAEEDGGFEGSLDWGYDGFLVYLKGNFGR